MKRCSEFLIVKKMQINTTMRYYILLDQDSLYGRKEARDGEGEEKITIIGEDVEKLEPCELLLVRMYDCVLLRKTVEFPQKIKSRILRIQQSHGEYVSKRIENSSLKRYLHNSCSLHHCSHQLRGGSKLKSIE